MEKIIQTFEGLIRRSLAPSVTFFVVLALGDLIRVKLDGGLAREQIKNYLVFVTAGPLVKSPALFITLAILVIIGLSYGLMAVQQVAFDNWLKKHFNPLIARFEGSDSKALSELRDKVVQRLNVEQDLTGLRDLKEVSDYVLYEILGGIDPTDTRSFVDSAKAMGIFFISVILVLLGNAGVYWKWLPSWGRLLLVVLAILFYWWGLEATRTQYRARALRLYVNFLAMPTQRIHRRLLRPDEKKAPSSKDKKKES